LKKVLRAVYPPTPTVLQIYPDAAWRTAVRIKPAGMDETIAHLKKTYEQLEPAWIFNYRFLDDNFDAMYRSEQRLGILLTIFTYLAIIVACLGLFGLVEYSVNQRMKEISIRKVFGASIGSLLIALTQRYFVLLTIAFLLIAPLSYYLAGEWLTNFEYRIDLDWTLFLKVAFIILSITVVTVSFQSIRAAVRNPAEVLKNE
jgi:putative ABC transport system permease protein